MDEFKKIRWCGFKNACVKTVKAIAVLAVMALAFFAFDALLAVAMKTVF